MKEVSPPAIVKPAADLGALAAEANAAHREGETASMKGLEHFKKAGHSLLKAKAALPHGKFGPWVAKHVRFSHQQACKYMKVCREWDKIKLSLNLADALKVLTDAATDDDDESSGDPPPKDEEGHPIPETVRPAFATLALYDEAKAHAGKLRDVIDKIAKEPGGSHLARRLKAVGSDEKISYRSEDLDNVFRDVKFTRPYSVCPYCCAEGDCNVCHGEGWIEKTTWNTAEDSVKARLAVKEDEE